MLHTPPLSAILVTLTTLALIGLLSPLVLGAAGASGDELIFSDLQSQTQEFIGYESSIRLTPEQEAIKKAALTKIPAPCCSDNTIYTCCCPCNLALTAWGLSHFLIAEHGYDADQVRTKVEEWIEFVNSDGFSGDVCYTSGGCMRAFANNGCGGMDRHRVQF